MAQTKPQTSRFHRHRSKKEVDHIETASTDSDTSLSSSTHSSSSSTSDCSEVMNVSNMRGNSKAGREAKLLAATEQTVHKSRHITMEDIASLHHESPETSLTTSLSHNSLRQAETTRDSSIKADNWTKKQRRACNIARKIYLKEIAERKQAQVKTRLMDMSQNFPHFLESELVYGDILGTGGFGTVREIRGFDIDDVNVHHSPHTLATSSIVGDVSAASSPSATSPKRNMGRNRSFKVTRKNVPDQEVPAGEHESRKFMSKNIFRREGHARYAVKKLSPEIGNIDAVANYWGGFTPVSYDITSFPAAVQTIGGGNITVNNLFYSVVSSDFRQGSKEAIGVSSTYPMGLPINGYRTSSQGTEDQHADVGQWLWEEYDSFLKNAGFPGVDVYFSDSEYAMRDAETGYLALQSFMLFPGSLIFVLAYLIYMQDSFFLGLVGVMQILLCFIPGLIIYRYVAGIGYLGVLNLIAIYIILGIGVDDLFVFCDQWQHHASEKRFDQRLQKTFNVASKAMFTTSCTTFISFISNAGSVFPAVATFGIFAAIMVMVNFCAITLFFPSAFGVYFKLIRHRWWDHPSRLFCCNRDAWTEDIYVKEDTTENDTSPKREDVTNEKVETPEQPKSGNEDSTNSEDDPDAHKSTSKIVNFFQYTWAPMVIKMRYLIVVFFVGLFVAALIVTAQLEPDESPPNTLPEDNVYREYTDVLLEYFARSGNPEAIEVRWVSGIHPDDPISRAGTSETNTTDYGDANFVDCSVYNPSTAEAQVWNLQTCHDLFFGNVTAYHGDTDDFALDGAFGPRNRKILTDRIPATESSYYQVVSCPHQGFRDWLLTDYGCDVLQSNGLECYKDTIQRPNCVTWDTGGNSCEPYPVPPDQWGSLWQAFLQDPNSDPSTRQTNYDKYFRQVFAAEISDLNQDQQDLVLQDDFQCRVGNDDQLVLMALSTTAKLDQTFQQNYEDGLALYDLWDEWSVRMRDAGPREVQGSFQTSNSIWSYYFLCETLIQETFASIGLALGLSFVVLSVVGGNPVMALLSVVTIFLIVVDVFAFTVLMGWKLGVLEAVNYVVVIGLSIDYTVHLSEAYTESHASDRVGRVTLMLAEMGVSVLSGALSTLGAVFFMFFAPNTFFVKFAAFIFATISLSCVYSLLFFPAILAVLGPTGDFGNVAYWCSKQCRAWQHRRTEKYLQTEEFRRRTLAHQVRDSGIRSVEELSRPFSVNDDDDEGKK